MHYCFSSVGSWKGNASQLRPCELGRELLLRNHQVSYILDDVPFNRDEVKLPVGSSAHFVKSNTGFGQFSERQTILATIKPDYFHVLNPSPKSYMTCRGLSKSQKIVADYDEWTARRDPGFFRQATYRHIDAWFRKRASLICVSSKYMQKQFALEFNASALYLPYAIYLHELPAVPNPFSSLTFVYVGSFFTQYDHDILFNAALELKQKGLSPNIEFLGQGPELEKWRRFVVEHSLSNIQIRGYVSDSELWARVSHANVLLFPIRPSIGNLSRCPSKTYLYAQAKRPIVTCAVSEVPLVLGDRATYVDPTSNAFASAMAERMNTPLPDVDYNIEQHNWSVRTDALLEALNSNNAK